MRKPEMVATPEDFPGLVQYCEECKRDNMPKIGIINKENEFECFYHCICGFTWWASPNDTQEAFRGVKVEPWDSPGRPKGGEG